MASSSSSTSTISTLQANYDVFLSFRGEDTRVGFTSHLDAALNRKQIQTFIDNNLKRGEEISPSLLKAIEESKLSVIVFSENYASSKWCLDELAKIVDCRKKGQIVIPIFYQVDPSHVRNQIGSFGDTFARLLRDNNLEVERVRGWREALTEVANLSGWDLKNSSSESEFTEEIVKEILKKLREISPVITQTGLIGIDARIKKVESLLNIDESQDVGIVGLWGMGGIGKTTIARAVCNNIRNQFEGVFFTNLREELKRHSMIDLQRNFLAQLLDQEILKMGFVSFGNSFIKNRLRRKKVVIVLDDVDKSTQLQEFQELLIRRHDSFCPGSRIIVTSRDKQLLRNVVDENQIYEVEGLEYQEALQLFSLKAFKSCSAPVDYAHLSRKMVNYANGNPLALIVVGSALYGRSKEFWDSAINKLGKVSNPEIQNVLRISYDGLDQDQRDIFLDIAYFFNRMGRDQVTKILQSWYSSVPSDIAILADKSLITICGNTVKMHDMLREMAFNIVREESKNPCKRSRLCDEEDVYRVLKKKKGTDSIEGISLDMDESEEMRLESDAFRGMENLRWLIFHGHLWREKVHLPDCGLEYLSDELRYLRWDGFPSKYLPPSFRAENLVELLFSWSKVEKLWTGVQNVVNLRRIDLRECRGLIELPDLSKASSLEELDLRGCESITEVPSHIQYLHKLEYLNFSGCSKLTSVPRRIDSKHLIQFLMCSCPNIVQCPEISGDFETLWIGGQVPQSMSKFTLLSLSHSSNMTEFPKVPDSIERLRLKGIAVVEVPSSIAVLTRLAELDMNCCEQLSSLPTSICKLKSLTNLNLCGCRNLKSFPEVMEPMESLTYLNLCETGIAELPSSIQLLPRLSYLGLHGTPIKELPSSVRHLKSLESLELQRTPITHLPELPPCLKYLRANGCKSLETISCNNHETDFEVLEFAGCFKLDHNALVAALQLKIQSGKLGEYGGIVLVGSQIPEWFSDKCVGHSITMRLPAKSDQLKGIVFSLVFPMSIPWNDLPEELILDKYLGATISFSCHAKTNNGGDVDDFVFKIPCEISWQFLKSCQGDHMSLSYFDLSWPNRVIQSSGKDDWVFRRSGEETLHFLNLVNKYSSNDVTFEFYQHLTIGNISKQCEVKKCGVNFVV